MSLPKVHEDCCHPVEREILDDNFMLKMAKRIKEDNPTVARVLYEFVDLLPDCCKTAAMLGSFMTYRLLENQYDVNKLEEELNV